MKLHKCLKKLCSGRYAYRSSGKISQGVCISLSGNDKPFTPSELIEKDNTLITLDHYEWYRFHPTFADLCAKDWEITMNFEKAIEMLDEGYEIFRPFSYLTAYKKLDNEILSYSKMFTKLYQEEKAIFSEDETKAVDWIACKIMIE